MHSHRGRQGQTKVQMKLGDRFTQVLKFFRTILVSLISSKISSTKSAKDFGKTVKKQHGCIFCPRFQFLYTIHLLRQPRKIVQGRKKRIKSTSKSRKLVREKLHAKMLQLSYHLMSRPAAAPNWRSESLKRPLVYFNIIIGMCS